MSAIARMDDSLKSEAESILNSIGITPSEAIKMAYTKIVNRHKLPLEFCMPNATTLAAFAEVDNEDKNIETYTHFDELLNADD